MRRQKKAIMVRVQALNGEEPEKSDDVIQRELLGPRGVLGAPDPARLSPQGEKNTPKHIDFGTVHRLAMAAGGLPSSVLCVGSGRATYIPRHDLPGARGGHSP
ncbi:hypothetical protein QA635_08010 [Bradyrhizobium brasilense]|uniref:hypothetical protein n=1 Tax=Bradyrhizobium brasilense TaxID=1419277 RepID=UPI0024B0748E|nr:hypothetical protein [Bradyrhizobium australafricanum]WFU37234.1 hypothetical protein QA635_08010 [Bradyrhizobium australafricanum]